MPTSYDLIHRFLASATFCFLCLSMITAVHAVEGTDEGWTVYASAFAGHSNAATERGFGVGGLAFNMRRLRIVSGHNEYELSDCRVADLRFCIHSPILTFSVPVAMIEGARWEVSGREFKLVRKKTIAHRGAMVTAFDVLATDKKTGSQFWFVYSETMGLLAIARWPKESSTPEDLIRGALYLSGDLGIGSH